VIFLRKNFRRTEWSTCLFECSQVGWYLARPSGSPTSLPLSLFGSISLFLSFYLFLFLSRTSTLTSSFLKRKRGISSIWGRLIFLQSKSLQLDSPSNIAINFYSINRLLADIKSVYSKRFFHSFSILIKNLVANIFDNSELLVLKHTWCTNKVLKLDLNVSVIGGCKNMRFVILKVLSVFEC
jgi:hypothetical protein